MSETKNRPFFHEISKEKFDTEIFYKMTWSDVMDRYNQPLCAITLTRYLVKWDVGR